MRRILLWGVLGVLVLLVAMGVAMRLTHIADRLLLYPTTHPIAAPGAMRHSLPYEGGELELVIARTAPARDGADLRAYVLLFTGNATRAEEAMDLALERWREWPVEIWAVNYPGYGASTGPAALARIPPAALAAYDALAERARGTTATTPIVLDGNSMGTTAALHVAAHRRCAGVVLQSPPPLRRLILQKFGWWNLWLAAGPLALQVPDELDSIANARGVSAPAIFITGDRDTLVPPKYQEYVFAAYAGPARRVVLEGKGHDDVIDAEPERAQFHAGVETILTR